MRNNLIESSVESTENKWNIFVLSNNSEFIDAYKSSIDNLIDDSIHLNTIILNDCTNFLEDILDFTCCSIIHIDCTENACDGLKDKIKLIRENDNCKNAFITIWYNESWGNLPDDLIGNEWVNEIRTTNIFNSDKIKHVIYSNIQNQKQILDLISLKKNLESKIEERTASLTRLNKKLQSAIIKNSNIKTKLHQQKLQIEKQNHEIHAQNKDLEKSFKKSSRQHIRLHKVLLENEEQRERLESALEEIKENNENLKLKNEEIVAQNEHIDQQREEIQTQRDMAVQQHGLIQIHQNEINENITYARRIQNAMLTPSNLLTQLIPEHFVLNKPKDIVSGDFFWVAQNLNYTIIAVADCTGHGISGAMMSMLGIAFLNEIVNNNGIIHSADILEQLRERIIVSLHQEYSHDISFSRDGMDISIAVIDIVEQKLEYSGANNPIYIIRKDELLELRPDKMPIGIHEFFEESFNSQYFHIRKKDTIYMFSDGYADQFGGSRGNKMKYKRFKKLLLEASLMPIKEQKKFLIDAFEKWRGEYEQIDDVIVLGYKYMD